MEHIYIPGSEKCSSVSRRTMLGIGALGMATISLQTNLTATEQFSGHIRELERNHDVTIGIHAHHLKTGRRWQHRPELRFPICSLFKVLAVGALSMRYSPYNAYWQKPVAYTPDDIVPHSPITGQTTTWTMTVSQLADAALRFSDNTAGNLLLKELGGPLEITRFAESLGASKTRLDRWEPDLNEALPGDHRDTTTANDIALIYQALLIEDRFGILRQTRLREWMLRNTTSDTRIRAGVTGDFELADKTGGGSFGVANNAGVLWRESDGPIVLVLLSRSDDPNATPNDEVIAESTRIILADIED